jgi:GntR family transcriptional regulator/MocR family aminotransferase
VAAGLHLVAELPDTVDDREIARRARLAGLGPLALSALSARPGGAVGLVLGYAAHSPDQLRTAVRRLARIVAEVG